MFEMTITTGISEVDAIFKTITMYVDGFTAPNRTQEYVDVGFRGYQFPVPTIMKMEQDHTLTVRCDTAGEIRRAFLRWEAETTNPDIEGGSLGEGDKRLNNASIVRLQLLDQDFSKTSEVYKLIGVKVANVGGMTMSNNESGVATFEVTLKSVYWQIENASQGALTSQK